MKLPLPISTKPDIFSYEFDRFLNRAREFKSDNSVIYNTSNQTSASNISFGALNMGSGTSAFGVDPSKGLWMGAEKFEDAPARITMTGDATFNSIDLGTYQRVVNTTENIQDAIDDLTSTGGIVFLTAGIHTPLTDIVIPSNVELRGQGIETTFIYFTIAGTRIEIVGTAGYNTGTITVNNGSTTVEGAGGTAWVANLSSAMEIKLGDYWYGISSITDNDTLELDSDYVGANLAGQTYSTRTPVRNSILRDFTVFGSTLEGIYADYTYNLLIDHVITTLNGGNGITIKNSNYDLLDIVYSVSNGGDGIEMTDNDHCVVSSAGLACLSNVAYGIYQDNSNNVQTGQLEIKGNGSGGLYFTDCNNCMTGAWQVHYNTGIGVEIIDCNRTQFTTVSSENNTSDGVKFTSGDINCALTDSILFNNGGYGVNIADSTSEKIILSANTYKTNTSGAFKDSGTDTINDLITMQSITTTTAYTISTPNYLIIYNLASGTETTMPSATGSGRVYHLKNIGIGDLTISASTGQLIDGQGSQVITQWDSVGLMDYASGSWVII